MRPIFELIRVLFCYADMSSELCGKNDGIFSCLHKRSGGPADFP